MHKHTEPAITASEMRPATAPTSTSWAQKLALIGPAFIAGAWQFGPGNLTSAVEAGSAYGYALLWVIAVSTVLMIFFTDMSVRIGIAAPGTMIATIKETLGRTWGVLAGVSVFFITLCLSVGNAAGSGLALSMLFGGSALFWTAACTVGPLPTTYRARGLRVVSASSTTSATRAAGRAIRRMTGSDRFIPTRWRL